MSELALMEIAGAALGRLGADRVEGFPLASNVVSLCFAKPKGLSFSTTHLDLATSPYRRMSIHYSHSLFPFTTSIRNCFNSLFPFTISFVFFTK